ncbi:9730_t:CDS:2, partial [Acaulospora colombiana]
LEFDEFLKIEGCKTGKHVFVKKKRTDETGAPTEELIQCRIDHYQTPGQVLATIYAKKCSQADSEITFEPTRVHINLSLPDSKRFKRTLELFGAIVPEKSTYKVYGTKVDMTLVKSDARSWNLLESTNAANLAGIGFNLTFGVGGRTGTVGAKEAVLDDENKS